jgi:hypothetical protein
VEKDKEEAIDGLLRLDWDTLMEGDGVQNGDLILVLRLGWRLGTGI